MKSSEKGRKNIQKKVNKTIFVTPFFFLVQPEIGPVRCVVVTNYFSYLTGVRKKVKHPGR